MRTVFRNIVSVSCWVLTGLVSPAFAQLDDVVRNHVIIAIDTKTEGRTQDRSLASVVYDAVCVEDTLLRKGDLLSVVQYAASVSDPSFKRYVVPARTQSGKTYTYHPIENRNEVHRILYPNWSDFATSNVPGRFYSLSSVAKPYALAALPFAGEYTNRTFIVLVTDHQYNGNDFYQELTEWAREAGSWMDKKAIMQKCFDVENDFFLAYMDSKVHGRVYVDIYECRPLQASLALSSVLYYPPKLKPVRKKGDSCELVFESVPQPGDHFKVKRLDIFPEFSDGSRGIGITWKDRDSVHVTFPYPARKRVTSLRVRAWVLLNDGLYGSVILSPSPDAPVFLGRNGLNVSIPVDAPDEAKVFGFRLPDALWWFYPDDPFKCAFLMEIILVVLLVAAILAGLASLKTYRPKKGQVHLK